MRIKTVRRPCRSTDCYRQIVAFLFIVAACAPRAGNKLLRSVACAINMLSTELSLGQNNMNRTTQHHAASRGPSRPSPRWPSSRGCRRCDLLTAPLRKQTNSQAVTLRAVEMTCSIWLSNAMLHIMGSRECYFKVRWNLVVPRASNADSYRCCLGYSFI